MNWQVVIRPEVESDVAEAARWYESQQAGLGAEFVVEIIQVWDDLAKNPLLNARRHPRKNIRWCYPERFPYRVIYEVSATQQTVVVRLFYTPRGMTSIGGSASKIESAALNIPGLKSPPG
jgi:plasmid stabilization system protein ParE